MLCGIVCLVHLTRSVAFCNKARAPKRIDMQYNNMYPCLCGILLRIDNKNTRTRRTNSCKNGMHVVELLNVSVLDDLRELYRCAYCVMIINSFENV